MYGTLFLGCLWEVRELESLVFENDFFTQEMGPRHAHKKCAFKIYYQLLGSLFMLVVAKGTKRERLGREMRTKNKGDHQVTCAFSFKVQLPAGPPSVPAPTGAMLINLSPGEGGCIFSVSPAPITGLGPVNIPAVHYALLE